jgi:plasmid replication initiation protein
MVNISDARGYYVVISNELIHNILTHTRELTAVEQKIILYLISLIKPNDYYNKPPYIYEFDVKSYCKICGIEERSTYANLRIKQSLENIATYGFWLTEEKPLYFQWFVTPEIIDNIIEIEIPSKIFKYLVGLKENFTEFELRMILPMSSQYSIAMYELLKSYSFRKEIILDIDYLRRYFGATILNKYGSIVEEKYKDFKDFKKRVLNVALNEINKYTDLDVSWEGIKLGKSYIKIKFTINNKGTLDRYKAYVNNKIKLDG